MNPGTENYHVSSMPALRSEQRPDAKPYAIPEGHKYPQAHVYLHIQDMLFQLAKVDNTERGRAAAESMLALLNTWNLDFKLDKL